MPVEKASVNRQRVAVAVAAEPSLAAARLARCSRRSATDPTQNFLQTGAAANSVDTANQIALRGARCRLYGAVRLGWCEPAGWWDLRAAHEPRRRRCCWASPSSLAGATGGGGGVGGGSTKTSSSRASGHEHCASGGFIRAVRPSQVNIRSRSEFRLGKRMAHKPTLRPGSSLSASPSSWDAGAANANTGVGCGGKGAGTGDRGQVGMIGQDWPSGRRRAGQSQLLPARDWQRACGTTIRQFRPLAPPPTPQSIYTPPHIAPRHHPRAQVPLPPAPAPDAACGP